LRRKSAEAAFCSEGGGSWSDAYGKEDDSVDEAQMWRCESITPGIVEYAPDLVEKMKGRKARSSGLVRCMTLSISLKAIVLLETSYVVDVGTANCG
jgi:hypothetical protein